MRWLRKHVGPSKGTPIRIDLAGRSERERDARTQLLRLLDTYDLKKWNFANRVRIEWGVIPHSHPVITLNTKYLDDDALALSNYLHEQLHRHLAPKHWKTRAALRDLHRRYPKPPPPGSGGAADDASTYLHYLVCYLEYLALKEVVGAGEALRVIEFWAGDHYIEVYKTVLQDFDAIGEIVARHQLLP